MLKWHCDINFCSHELKLTFLWGEFVNVSSFRLCEWRQHLLIVIIFLSFFGLFFPFYPNAKTSWQCVILACVWDVGLMNVIKPPSTTNQSDVIISRMKVFITECSSRSRISCFKMCAYLLFTFLCKLSL